LVPVTTVPSSAVIVNVEEKLVTAPSGPSVTVPSSVNVPS
jgi:hypothetical protein